VSVLRGLASHLLDAAGVVSRWDDPAAHERQADVLRALRASPTFRAALALALRRARQKPDYRRRIANRMARCWSDPNFRRARLATLRSYRTLDDVLARVEFEPNSGCWLWTGRRLKGGYGRVTFQGRQVLVHRLSFSLRYEVPLDHAVEVHHECRQASCCNPRHLKALAAKVHRRRRPRPRCEPAWDYVDDTELEAASAAWPTGQPDDQPADVEAVPF
jgi:hypothetical protein